MNIEDVKDVDEKPVDILKAIFDKQFLLCQKYHDIEKTNGLLQTDDFPVNLHDPKGQARLKDFAWRVTEELGEATESFEDTEHFREEVIDALHFLVELMLTAGMTSDDFDSLEEMMDVSRHAVEMGSLDKVLWTFTEKLAISMNCLKNKPWKQTHMETDIKYLKKCLRSSMYWFVGILVKIELTPMDVYNYYFKKNAVNQFRQRSNY